MSLSEYVDRINAIEERAGRQVEELFARAAEVTDITPQDVQAGLEAARAIRIEVKEAADRIEPPKRVEALHDLIFDWHTGFIDIEAALAERAGTAADTVEDWTDLSNSPEMAAYRDAIAEGKHVCQDFQAQLDAAALAGTFADIPWLPGQMKDVGRALVGCEWFPEDPEDVYRYPPAS